MLLEHFIVYEASTIIIRVTLSDGHFVRMFSRFNIGEKGRNSKNCSYEEVTYLFPARMSLVYIRHMRRKTPSV